MRQNTGISRLIVAFVAGFISVLLFHQVALFVLQAIGIAPAKLAPYAMTATQPFGIPRVFSLAFWGGVWGIALVVFVSFFRQGIGSWGAALLFGALAPSLVNWFVVMPLKGEPVGGGWKPAGIATSFIVNGVWGLGTVVLFRLFARSPLGRNQHNSLADMDRDQQRIHR